MTQGSGTGAVFSYGEDTRALSYDANRAYKRRFCYLDSRVSIAPAATAVPITPATLGPIACIRM